MASLRQAAQFVLESADLRWTTEVRAAARPVVGRTASDPRVSHCGRKASFSGEELAEDPVGTSWSRRGGPAARGLGDEGESRGIYWGCARHSLPPVQGKTGAPFLSRTSAPNGPGDT